MLSKFFRAVKAVVGYGLVIGAVALVALSVVLPRAIGGAALTVSTGSMTPTLPVGSLVIVRPVDPAEVKVGDVITFVSRANSSDVTTHRVIEINREDGMSFTTQGDANPGPDSSPVDPEAVRGRVWFDIPHVGILRNWLTSVVGLGTMAGASAIVLGGEAVQTRFSRTRRPGRVGGARRTTRRRTNRLDGAELAPQQGLLLFTVERHHRQRRDVDDLMSLWCAEIVAADARTLTGKLVAAPPALKAMEAALAELGVTAMARADAVADPVLEVGHDAAGDQALLLLTVHAESEDRGEVLALVTLLHGRVVGVDPSLVCVALSGTAIELSLAEELLETHGIVRSSRSPSIPIPRLSRIDTPPTIGAPGIFDATVITDAASPDTVVRLAALSSELRGLASRDGGEWCS